MFFVKMDITGLEDFVHRPVCLCACGLWPVGLITLSSGTSLFGQEYGV